MSYALNSLQSKRDVDRAVKETIDKVLVLRFGKEDSLECLRIDEILRKTAPLLSRMADIYVVDSQSVPVYTRYFDISITPATVFFFNGQHMKVDYGTADHTKFIGCFKTKQDFIDLVEVIYRGAMQGKLVVTSPIDPAHINKYDLLYMDI
ncbi:thioredoxin-like protein 4B [Ixodes scapularis]|uniref:thioredoxin-like protein 4B n=1 Tax=Ixodes scapularis TaxID=6945 RepID=UPI0011618E3F|nr:thioredoxin-like protein 4B [Ixodes scapularis]